MSALPDELEMLNFVRKTLHDTQRRDPASIGSFYFRDRFYHTLRVVNWVKRLCCTEQCDRQLAIIAAIFHDVGYESRYKAEHAALSEKICRAYMDEHGFDAETTARVCELVAQHSLKKRPANELSIELRVLMDADLLDELGITIVMWDSMDEGAHHQGGYYSVLERVRRAYTKLTPLLDIMKTPTGYNEYALGLDVLKNAINRIEYELHIDSVADYFRCFAEYER